MRAPFAISLALLVPIFISCGGSPRTDTERPDAVSGATDTPAPVTDGEEATAAGPCHAPINGPAEVFPRIEEIRGMGADERAKGCDMQVVEVFAGWRCPPMDILGEVMDAARKDGTDLVEWVRSSSNPKAGACVAAADIVGGWKAGDDPKSIDDTVARWSGAGVEGLDQVIEASTQLQEVLGEVNEIHKLRCMLEVNVLGFAVECKPIHPQGKPIALNWQTATRDGLIEDLKITECKGKSCKRLKATAAQMVESYRALVKKVERLGVGVFEEAVKAQLVLRPFKSRG